MLTGTWQRQFLPASVIHDAAETLASAVLDAFEDDLMPAQYMMAFASSTMYTSAA